jgi:DNA-binding transcriptional ArsR family regulator
MSSISGQAHAASEHEAQHGAAALLARERLLSPQEAQRVAGMFALLGDSTRVRTLHALASAGELCVRDLAWALGRDASTISHQLRVLRDHHLVTCDRRGRVAWYRLADSHVLTLFQQALAHTAHDASGPALSPLTDQEARHGALSA